MSSMSSWFGTGTQPSETTMTNKDRGSNRVLVLIADAEDHAEFVNRFFDCLSSACGADVKAYDRRMYRMFRKFNGGGETTMKSASLLDLAYQLRVFDDFVPIDVPNSRPMGFYLLSEAVYYAMRVRQEDCVVVLTRDSEVKSSVDEFKDRHGIRSNLQAVLLLPDCIAPLPQSELMPDPTSDSGEKASDTTATV